MENCRCVLSKYGTESDSPRLTDPYEMTATGILGIKRHTMLSNPLLQKCQLGKRQNLAYSKPFDEKSWFGAHVGLKDGGTAEAMHWVVFKPSLRGSPSTAIQGTQTGKETEETSMQVPIRLPNAREATEGDYAPEGGMNKGEACIKSHYCSTNRTGETPSITFGMPTRSSMPVAELMENRFQKQWIEQGKAKLARDLKEKPSSYCPYCNCKLSVVRLPPISNKLRHHMPPYLKRLLPYMTSETPRQLSGQ